MTPLQSLQFPAKDPSRMFLEL